MMKLQIVLVIVGLAAPASALGAHVAPDILENLELSPTTNILVTFKNARTASIAARFDALNLRSREARLNTLHAMYKDHADTIQADVLTLLKKAEGVKKHYTSQLWISAEIIVRDVDKEIVEQLRYHPDVESLLAEEFFPLLDTVEEFSYVREGDANITNLQWGVQRVNADAVWRNGYNGQGIVVANIDTGVRHTHEALFSNYRGTITGSHNWNWFAPTQRTAIPSDKIGHGTHVAGTISGSQFMSKKVLPVLLSFQDPSNMCYVTGTVNGIGVAPGSQWIACRGCDGIFCSNFDLLECGNWVACPTFTDGTNPSCSQAPHVVNNSWGGERGDTFYNAILATWRTLNIDGIFSAGNSGPNCDTVHSPSDRPDAISVASTTVDDVISYFSSVGPTIDGRMKPDFACPGSDIVSASHLADNQYRSLSGTSMAAPHASGVAALIRSRNPSFNTNQVKAALIRGVRAITPSGRTCGGVPDSVRPNHHVGAGLSDASAAVQVIV
ncbi:Bacillopeptidase F [Pseudolycoriella hygida]|uniref:Bacillopeptidase F n=1 Tax=Pseudolycoriella hygida TaxID=35572 RepID=A0A9Q0RX89_9DIPT|nr:Bacillopeptidase F [Pseudolycoriella hygida]